MLSINIYYFIALEPLSTLMETKALTQNLSETREDKSVSFINSEVIKEQLTQYQTVSSSPTPTNFSLQNQFQPIQKHGMKRKKAIPWSDLEQLYYFDSVLRFVIDKPYLTVSWTQWKPLQYYKFIEKQMNEVFSFSVRDDTQIKAKDQNLKKQYRNKRNRKIDIVKVALQKLIFFVNKSKNLLIKAHHIEKAMLRCDQTLRIYKEMLSKMQKPKAYEISLAKLVRFIQTADGQAHKMQSQISSLIAIDTNQASSQVMDLRS